jgi:transposase-like protein
MRERGLHVDHTTIYRWVQQYAPELERRCRPHLKPTTDSWRVDETYIKVKFLNNLVEQDHRFLKRLVNPGLGFFSPETAWRTLQGYEIMHRRRKGQIRGVEKGDIIGQVACIASLFLAAA